MVRKVSIYLRYNPTILLIGISQREIKNMSIKRIVQERLQQPSPTPSWKNLTLPSTEEWRNSDMFIQRNSSQRYQRTIDTCKDMD